MNAVLEAQVAAGQCQLGSDQGYCKMADGSEVGCNFIRECRPDLHFEYSSGSGGKGSGNANIWVWQDFGTETPSFIWSGPGPAPAYAPNVGQDPFGGGPMPVVDYSQYFAVTAPTPRVQSNAPAPYVPQGVQQNNNGGVIAPANIGGLLERIQNYLQSLLGLSPDAGITQTVFCQAYQASSGYPCDFDATVSGAKRASEWLVMLQQQQAGRISVVGNRSMGGGTGTGTVTQPPVQQVSNKPGGMGALLPILLIGLLVYAATR